MKLHWQILLAIIFAIGIGLLLNEQAVFFGIAVKGIFEFIGTLFLNALKMIIVPLIVSSIICGVSNLGGGDSIGRLGGKTIGFYMLSSLLAILVGLMFVNFLEPGIIDGKPARDHLNLSSSEAISSQLEQIGSHDGNDLTDIFLRMIPPNIVKAAAEGQMLGLICFCLIFGFFMRQLQPKLKDTLVNFWQAVFETMMSVTMFIMKFAPLGVFGLVAKTVIETSQELKAFIEFMELLAVFGVTVFLALAFHTFVTLAIALKAIARVSPLKHYKAMASAMLTAFSTASSSGTLPVTMKCVEENAGVSNRISSFVLPLGATINMDGTALYECVAAMFIAQAYGLELSFVTQFTIVLIALLTSIGVAGIPAASLVAIAIILTAIGLPVEAIGLLMITDRILDMLRTAVNVFSDSCCAVIIAKTEGENQVLSEY